MGAVSTFSPVLLHAAGENVNQAKLLVACDGSKTGGEQDACNFRAFMQQVQMILNFLISISIPITTLVIAYIGFKYMTAQGDSGVISDSKKMIIAVLKGFAFMLLAWLIIHTLIGAFINEGEFGSGFLNTFIQSN